MTDFGHIFALIIRKVLMSVLFILVIISLLLALGFLGAFVWSVKTGQMDDDYTPSVRILFDNNNNQSNKQS
jgi:cbb3-type cytochrome oxidase maturation protein